MTLPSDIAAYVAARQAEVDAELEHILPAVPACPEALAHAMRYSLTAGGKRVRPVLCLASAEAVGGRVAEAMPAACALELIHTYSLDHDDLPAMDNDTMRRGKPTLHVVVGDGLAILAGDGLLTEAFALLAREPDTDDPEVVRRKLRTLGLIATAAGVTGMVGGQAIDLGATQASSGTNRLGADGVRRMHAMKTGALITAAAASGAVMGGGSPDQVEAITVAAAEMGLAFQIVDDILDVVATSDAIGKTAGKDAAAGKPTYPALFGMDASRRLAHECLERAEEAVARVGLADTALMGIARWIVERSS